MLEKLLFADVGLHYVICKLGAVEYLVTNLLIFSGGLLLFVLFWDDEIFF